MESQTQTPEAQVVVDTVQNLFKPEIVKVKGQSGQTETEVLILPDGHGGLKPHSVKGFLGDYRKTPERRSGVATMTTLDSFVDHVNRFKDVDSAVFAQNTRTNPSMKAVFDYHRRVNKPDENGEIHADPNADPRFGVHSAVYQFPMSEEWKAWDEMNGQKMSQAEFAEFLEDRIGDVEAAPPLSENSEDDDEPTQQLRKLLDTLGGKLAGPGTLMDLSRGLKVTAEEKVHNHTNLSSGEVQIQYTHEHMDEQGQPLKVPNLFLINIPVFKSGDVYRIFVRLRYTIRSGSISWSYQLYRTDKVFDAAFDAAVEDVRETTELPVFYGQPEN